MGLLSKFSSLKKTPLKFRPLEKKEQTVFTPTQSLVFGLLHPNPKKKELTCEDCPLHKTTQTHCIQSDGPITAPVLFIGEAPGRNEDKEGKVFIGSTGKLLRSFLEDAEFVKGEFRLCNIVRCHPGLDKDGKDNEPPTKAISCCLRFLREEIRNMPNLKVIVPLGAKALKPVTGKTGITAWTGQRLESILPEARTIPVIPNFHPSYISRNENELTFAQYLQDLLDIHEEFIKGNKEKKEKIECKYTLVNTIEQLDSMLESLKKFDVVAFDVETHNLFPYHTGEQILVLSFSGEPGVAYCIPYMHKDAKWSVIDRKKVHAKLKNFLESDQKFVAHNAQFDCLQLRANFDTIVKNVIADTLLMHYAVDETKGTHGLDRLAYVYTDMGGYNEPLNKFIATKPSLYDPAKGGSYNNIPIDVLFPYSAGDSDCCLRLFYVIGDEIRKHEYSDQLSTIAFNLMPVAVEGITNVQANGAFIDMSTVNFLDSYYIKKMTSLVEDMVKIPEVVEFITDKRRRAKAIAKEESNKKKKTEDFEFNPGSPDQIRDLFFGYLGLQPVKETDKGKLSTDEEVLEALKGQHKLVDLVSEHRSTSKLHGTYIKSVIMPKGKRPPLLCRDGCLRSSYLLHGTTTGRLSSQKPNLQNIPRSGDIKKMFVSRFGDDGVIFEADYSQIELRIVAMVSEDDTMMDVYSREGGDIHMETAISIFNKTAEELTKDKEKYKEKRAIAKRTNFGIVYGTGPQGLMDQLKREGIIITKEEAKKYIDRFYEKYTGVGLWIEEQEKFTVESLISISPFGRVRHLPMAGSPDEYLKSDALRAAVNHPIQSAASDFTLMSISKLGRIFREQKLRSVIILTVHDSIIFDVYKPELEIVAKLVKTTMESVKDWAPKFVKGIDTSWICLPIRADIGVGKSWKELEEYKLPT
jgi:uracil-DNA glycosylase family 4